MTFLPELPDDSFQIRCPRLGHQIHFSYCRRENFGLPCPRCIVCWQAHFAVAAFLRRELTGEQWRDAFEKPVQPKLLTLVELIELAKKRGEEGKKGKG